LGQILPDPVPEDGRKWAFILTESKKADDLAELAKMWSAGTLRAPLHQGKTFEFSAEGWGELMKVSNSGRAKGKLVMKII